MRGIALFSGSSHPALAQAIANRLSINLGKVTLGKFSNKESRVEIHESIRNMDVYIVQSGCGAVNDNLMELLIMINACKTASAHRVTAVIPCFPYSRQPDEPFKKSRVEEGYKLWAARPGTLIANMLVAAGVDHIITMDLHDAQFQGFFDIPVDNLFAQPVMLRYIIKNVPDYVNEAVIVSPDAGGAKRATALAEKLGMEFAIIHNGRRKSNARAPELLLVGDVRGKTAILIDDIADTCYTVAQASRILAEAGAKRVIALVTHAIMSARALETIQLSDIHELVVSNSIPQDDHQRHTSKIKVFDVASIFSEAIRRIHNGESVSFLFDALPL